MVQPRLEGIARLDSLSMAWAKVKANRGGPGGDGERIGDFDKSALSRLNRLRLDVLGGSYWPGPLRRIEVQKPSGGWRPLTIPCVADRVLQTAVATAFMPVFEREMEPASYGYRPNRSVAMAVSRVATLRRQGFTWTVDADIKRYFETVPHAPLLKRVAALIEDERLVDLVGVWLDHAEPDGVGLPQGSPLSPLLANLYLDAADEALDGRDVRLVRFADDFVLLCKSEARASKALSDAQEALAALGLELNLEKTRIRPYDEALTFLGRLFVRSLVLDADANDAAAVEGAVRALEPAAEPPDPLMEPGSLEEPRRHRLAPRLRTLYVLEAGSTLIAEREQFVVLREGAAIWRAPAGKVDQIEVGPHADFTAAAVRLAAAHEVAFALVDGWGHVAARLDDGTRANAERQLAQAAAVLDPNRRLALARTIAAARLANQRALLRRLNRRRKSETVAAAAAAIASPLRRLERAKTPAEIMGFEGQAAAVYWPALGACLEHGWTLTKRVRRPPPDPVNLILSALSGRLAADLDVLIRRQDLHPGFGILHETAERDRPTLALDLVEIFRASLVEGLTVYLFNNRMLKHEHFTAEGDTVRLTPAGMKVLVRGYEAWLDRPVRSPFSGEDVLWRGLLEDQIGAVREAVEHGARLACYRMDY